MNTFHRFLLPLLILTLLASSCTNRRPEEASHRVLTVSIEPLRYFAEAVAGERFRVVTLVPRGSSPETYEPAPRQLVDLSESSAYLSVGDLGFEKTWMDRLMQNVPYLPVVNLSKGIVPLPGEHGTGVDPHTWTSPRSAAVIVQNLCETLCRIDTASAAYYTERAERLLQRIDSVDNVVRQTLEKCTSRTFLIYHPALGYLARDYGLTQVSLEEGGKEPTADSMRKLIRRAKNDSIRVLFVQQEFSEAGSQALADETGMRIVRINPLSYDWPAEVVRIATALCHE